MQPPGLYFSGSQWTVIYQVMVFKMFVVGVAGKIIQKGNYILQTPRFVVGR